MTLLSIKLTATDVSLVLYVNIVTWTMVFEYQLHTNYTFAYFSLFISLFCALSLYTWFHKYLTDLIIQGYTYAYLHPNCDKKASSFYFQSSTLAYLISSYPHILISTSTRTWIRMRYMQSVYVLDVVPSAERSGKVTWIRPRIRTTSRHYFK
jgi:hypothetical protein